VGIRITIASRKTHVAPPMRATQPKSPVNVIVKKAAAAIKEQEV
jgi:hypothetical protein